jgi:hypothetical protein
LDFLSVKYGALQYRPVYPRFAGVATHNGSLFIKGNIASQHCLIFLKDHVPELLQFADQQEMTWTS